MNNLLPEPRAQARFFFDNPPAYAIAVDEPWWWAVLALGADYINVHFDMDYRGPLAIVSRDQKPWFRRRDVEALEGILRAEKRPTFDAFRCPRAAGKVVGLVNVVDCVRDPSEPTSWFVGPYGLEVDRQCLLPIGVAGMMIPTPGMQRVTDEKRNSIRYALTAMANGHFQPGEQSK